ncbi:MAG TPA: site-specific integrase, partial [Bryobacteraceae bacterium]|nr:site-specific integrase [Bryobacteraceae bacterium]
ALMGIPVPQREKRIRSVADVIKEHTGNFGANRRKRTVDTAKERLAHVSRLLGGVLIPDLTEKTVREYISTRTAEGASGRTVNMEVGALSRAIGRQWSQLWPKLKKLDERTDVGKALSPAEEERLLSVLNTTKSQLGQTFVRIALLTGMRYSEILDLTWERVDVSKRVVTVGRAKTAAGSGRQIPMNDALRALLTTHADWYVSRFGECRPDLFLFPFGSPRPCDPTRPATTMKTFWETVRRRAKVQCRFHDLRHTVATKMAEHGVPESTMKALLGHMSRAMLERYSHIRMAAKRDAVECLNTPATASGAPPKVPPANETVKPN